MTTPLNIAIFGTGAMATLFAGLLTRKKEYDHGRMKANITLVGAWQEQIHTLRRDGLTVIHTDGSKSHHIVDATDNLAEVPPADIALILVKSHQTVRTAQQVARALPPDGMAITLQNGLGNYEALVAAVGQDRAGLGVTSQAATIEKPGLVRHAGEGPTFLANIPEVEKQLNQVAALFNEAGVETKVVENPDSLVWGKLAINAGINPLTALLEVVNGKLIEDRTLWQLMSAAVKEVARVAAAQNIRLPFDDPAQYAIEVCRATAHNRSSMLQDILRGAPTEIDAISGAVVKIGQQLRVPTPVNEFFLTQVKAKEAGHKFDGNQLKLINLDDSRVNYYQYS